MTFEASYEKQLNALKSEALSKESQAHGDLRLSRKKSLEARVFLEKERALVDKLSQT
jgi:hypothetical protein